MIRLFGALLLLAASCSPLPATVGALSSGFVSPAKVTKIRDLMPEHKTSSLGIGIIKNGKLIWTGYYGEQSPGIPVNSQTMFNTASVNKAVTTEAFLRLATKGVVDLDEPIAPYYVHPDLADDPNYQKLTPRIILTHKTGLRNWAYEYEDGKLAFLNEPGSKYGYSGAGFMILANFIQNKIGKPFPEIVKIEIFDRLGIENASVIQEKWMDKKTVRPVDKDGKFEKNFVLDHGYWNAADDLFISVEGYSKFLIGVMGGQEVGSDLVADRQRVQSDLTRNEIWGCDDGSVSPCPKPYGHGLGWFIFGYDGNLNIQHGGNDKSEAAIGYFETKTKDGMVIFINAPAPQGVLLWPKIVDILDEDAKFTAVFHHVIAKFFEPKTDQ